MDNLVQIINEFLVQAQKGDLKTSAYPREWSGLKMKVSFGMGAPARIPWIACARVFGDAVHQAYWFYSEGFSESKSR